MNTNADGERVTEAKSGRRRRHWLVWGMAVSIIVLLFSPVMIFRVVNKAAFERKVAELKAAGYPVSLDDLEAAYVLPEGVENAADVYLEAFKAYVEPNEAELALLPVRGNYEATDDMPPYPPEVIEAIRISLEKNKKCIELLDMASRIEHCLLPRSRQHGSFSTDDLRPITESLKMLNERNLYLAQTQQSCTLHKSVLTVIGMTKIVSKQPGIIEELVTLGTQINAVNGVESYLSLPTPQEYHLIQLQKIFGGMHQPDRFRAAFISERAGVRDFFNILMEGTKQQFSDFSFKDKLRFKVYLMTGLNYRELASILNFYDRQIKSTQMPAVEQHQAFRGIDAELNVNSKWSFYGLSETVGPIQFVGDIGLRTNARIQCAETALAVERYRLKYGKLPERLDKLVPEFLGEVYLDPFDGKPLRYALRAEGGYVIYTIGPDGADNGGLTREQIGTGAAASNQEDFPFTVKR